MNRPNNRPRTTETPSPDALDGHVYHRVVGPALEAAADSAARRGHRDLFDDMPAMLALVEMIARLADLYRQHYPALDDYNARLLDDAAGAAAVMVLQRSELPADAVNACLGALETALAQLHAEAVIDDAIRYIAMAWSHLDDDDREPARHCLRQASQHIIAAIEVWRGERH